MLQVYFRVRMIDARRAANVVRMHGLLRQGTLLYDTNDDDDVCLSY